MYETVIPEGGPWDKIIAVRLDSAATNGNWDNKLDQTSNISFDTEFNAESTIKITITGWEDENYTIGNDFYHSSRVYCFSDYLISETDSICENWKTNSKESYNTAWSNLQSQYNNMSSQSKELLKTAQADKDEIEDSVKIAMARYDHIVAKYPGINNFLERETTLSSRLFANSINSNNSTLIIVVVSISLLVIAGVGFVYYRKRRQVQ